MTETHYAKLQRTNVAKQDNLVREEESTHLSQAG